MQRVIEERIAAGADTGEALDAALDEVVPSIGLG
jgi:hypothetical protein